MLFTFRVKGKQSLAPPLLDKEEEKIGLLSYNIETGIVSLPTNIQGRPTP